MQLILNLKNVAVGSVLLVAGYYGYRGFVAGMDSGDVGELLRSHRQASAARQLILKRRILSLYDAGRDRGTVMAALDHVSPATQCLAIEIFARRHDRKAVPRLLRMLDDPERDQAVKAELAGALACFGSREAIPRLIELTDTGERHGVRLAAHNALLDLTGVGAGVKFSTASRQHWELWWRDHSTSLR